jgi:hypothetical protein
VLGTFKKTEVGIRELSTREHGLRAELRRLLILIDGKRSIDALVPLFRGNELSTLVSELMAHGLIEPVEMGGEPLPSRNAISNAEYALLTGPQLRAAIQAGTNAVNELLGGQAKPWVKKLEQCTDSAAFRGAVGEVQLALTEQLGSDAADIFLETIRERSR